MMLRSSLILRPSHSLCWLIAGVAVATTGCEKDDPPPPLPSAKPAETEKPLDLKAVDAAIEEEDAGEDKPKGTGGGARGGGGLSACCQALSQNATMAPEPTATYMKQAAAVCQSAASAGQSKSSAIALIQGALKGAGMPSACQ